jgi:hypothetical protein
MLREKQKGGLLGLAGGRVLLAVILGAVAAAAQAAPVMFRVAPDGDDAESDGPFATPARAARAVRELRATNGGRLPGPVTIEFRGGVYRLAEPLVLTPDDSGTRDAPVVWAAAPGERVVFSGGATIDAWREGQLNGRKVWVAKTPGSMFRSLWVDQDRRVRARHPNGHDHLTVPVAPEPDARWEDGQLQFNYKPGDVPDFTADDAEVMHFTRWVESRLPVLRNDQPLKELRFLRRTVFQVQAGDLFCIENAPEFLDQPGEWYLRQATAEVFYLPKPGETLDKFQATVPRLPQLLRLAGKPEKGKFVDHITFRGITFAHTEWTLPAEGTDPNVDGRPNRGGFVQAAYGVPGAVSAEGARHCTFEHCTFTQLGSYALELGRGCRDNLVSRCTLTGLGAGGVKIGERRVGPDEAEHTRRNTITDCTIAHYGNLFPSGVGIYIAIADDNRIAHNRIHDGYYTGISVGWTWGYEPNLTRGSVIEHNDVHHIGKRSDGSGPLLSDMGGLYTLGTQPGTVIRFNRFHDLEGRVYGGRGSYFDQGNSGIVAEYNLIYRTTHGGFHQHYGRDNVFRNNIIAYGRTRQVERSRSEAHQSFTFERNIVVWNQGVGIAGNWDNYNVAFRNNQYFPYGEAEPQFAYQSFEQWHTKGVDAGSLVADPGFVDPERGDFRFKPGGGPSESIGFQPWDLADVGPRDAN